jgi:hypothetical protein
MVRIRTLEVAVSHLPQMCKLVVDRSLEFLNIIFILFSQLKLEQDVHPGGGCILRDV